jgi:sulfane dehydrogenase subunit SoxC
VEQLEQVSTPGRVAERDEGLTVDELRLATRNAGMPLEALRYDVTPVGLHYLLVHYDIPHVDPAAWRLDVGGHVERPLRLDLDALRRRPSTTLRVTMECAGNGRARLHPRPISQPWLDEAVGTAEWTGTSLAPLLHEAGLRDGAVDVAFTGVDHGVERGVEQDYARGLSLDDALHNDVLVVWEMNGAPLLPQHGAPVRLLVPGWYGMASVKWLTRIDVLDRPFDGFQNTTAYRITAEADDAGEPVSRIRPRALMAPPGFPDFMSRTRVLDAGAHELVGRAWAGGTPVDRVEVSVDGGSSWQDADLDPPVGRWAWQRWSLRWEADAPGLHELTCRATADGVRQPVDQPWNRKGMANTMAQRVRVLVR